jgi:hypothetical protein
MKLHVAILFLTLLMSSSLPAADLRTQVRDQLTESGSDLSRPHKFDFYFYFPDREAADSAGKTAQAAGYDVVVRRAATGDDWLCLVSRRFVPSTAPWPAVEKFCRDLARAGKGEFDGWEAEVAK